MWWYRVFCGPPSIKASCLSQHGTGILLCIVGRSYLISRPDTPGEEEVAAAAALTTLKAQDGYGTKQKWEEHAC